MESQTAFVRAYRAVELHAITEVYVNLAFVVYPRNTECNHTFRLYYALDNLCAFKLGVLVVNIFHRQQHFLYGLQVLQFARMLLLQRLHYLLNVHSIII